jgi:hypothetical protein
MEWLVEVTDEYSDWFIALTEEERESIDAIVGLLAATGPALGSPHSSKIKGARTSHMRELRIQHQGRPYRVCMRSTLAGPRCCCLAATRRATIAGTT